MFKKEYLLDLIRHFVIYELDEGRTIKKLPRYPQIRATNKAIKKFQEQNQGGVIWHTQGSGKSLTMAYITRKLQAEEYGFKNPTVIIMTDRIDLDRQITYTPLEANYISGGNYNAGQLNIDIKYFDGLGRDIQDISIMASPDQLDMVKLYKYDYAGRSDGDYLPYEHPYQKTGAYNAGPEAYQKAFIEDLYGSSNRNYGLTDYLYENSPLNRVMKQSAPGYPWKLFPDEPNTEHVVEYSYETNDTEIASWKYVNNGFETVTYSENQLFKNVNKNENKAINQGISREYKDKLGNVVMVENMEGTSWIRTLYIYDDFDLLRCVVPPKASSPADVELCYFYQYDKRHRMIQKKLPDADWVYLVYDKRDRLVMVQDGKMRNENVGKNWLLTCYDQLNRPAKTGVYSHGSPALDQQDMQEHYDAVVTNLNVSRNNALEHSYTDNIKSQLSSTAQYRILTISYYDDYTWTEASNHSLVTNEYVNSSQILNTPKNLLTGSKIRVESDDEAFIEWMVSANHYDKKARIVQTVSDNAVEENDGLVVTTKYSFDGKPEIIETSHTAFSTHINLIERVKYDHRGRILERTLEGLPGQPKVMLCSNHYNRLGQLLRSQVHSTITGTVQNPFIQQTDYSYNIRGWLTGINDPSNTSPENDIFAMKLNYVTNPSGIQGQIQYNGNISSIEWATNRNSEKFAYKYSYDKLSRLNFGNFYDKTEGSYAHDGSFDEYDITYDQNGNIITLKRKINGSNYIDHLSYNYRIGGLSNQIDNIVDIAFDHPLYADYPGTSTPPSDSYSYDANGNMLKSADKCINTDILYSYLNKPEVINFGNGEKIEYIYDGTGNKICKKVLNGSELTAGTLIYIGNYIYDWNGNLQYILTADGRLVPDGDKYRFEYFMKDHLGNTRSTYAQAVPGLAQVAEYNHYYPFGMVIEDLSYHSGADQENNYLYNGKELQKDYGLEWYDYGARMYDPASVHFATLDPMAEERSAISPYTYCSNNPINRIDPDGRLDDWVENPDGKIKWDDKVTSANDKDLKVGDKYLGKNVLVGTDNRDAKLNEPLNSAKFELYLESNKEGPSATIMGNTVPSDIKKSGTLAEGLYTAESQSRASYIKKGKEDLALIINGGLSVPTAPGSPKTTMSEIFFHMGNNYQTSLFDSQGHAYSSGCQTSGSFPNSLKVHNAFMKTVGLDFKGIYYLRATPLFHVSTK